MSLSFNSLLLLAFWSFVLSPTLNSTPDPGFITIHIEARPAMRKKYLFDIYRTKSEIKIVYSLEKEVYYNLLIADKDFISANEINTHRMRSDSISKHWTKIQMDSVVNKFNQLFEKHTVYNKDSLLVKRKSIKSYDDVLMLISNSSVEELENKDGNKHRFVLDGTTMSFKIVSKLGTKIAYADSPDPKSHPLLNKLIKETFDIYNTNKGKGYVHLPKSNQY